MLGIVLSAIVAAALPPTFFEQYLSSEFASMLVMLLLSIPIYVCASEATPVAAALVLEGPESGRGAGLPAGRTGHQHRQHRRAAEVSSAPGSSRSISPRSSSFTLLAGFALNWVYRTWEIDPRATFGAATAFVPEPVKIGGALLLIVLLLVLACAARAVPGEWIWLRDRIASLTGVAPHSGKRLALTVAATLAVALPGERAVRVHRAKSA